MALFLTGSGLTKAIRRVVSGRDLRCAVAFWGTGAAQFLQDAGADLSGARILCDISMGGCWPGALEELGAPRNERLRRHDGLHAKVYISDKGMVVGSPNASANGIGFTDSGPVWLEAGCFHERNSPEWSKAVAWFNRLYRKAAVVDEKALADARRRFRQEQEQQALPVRKGSILDLVRADPGQFGTIGFVFTNTFTSKEDRQKARANLRIEVPKKDVDAMPDGGIFSNWAKDDLRRWPASFIELFLSPRGKLRVYGRRVQFFEPRTGSVFTKSNWRDIRSQMPGNAPAAASIAQADAEMAAAVLAHNDRGVLYSSPKELSNVLIALARARPLHGSSGK